jgi:hypothetical protein
MRMRGSGQTTSSENATVRSIARGIFRATATTKTRHPTQRTTIVQAHPVHDFGERPTDALSNQKKETSATTNFALFFNPRYFELTIEITLSMCIETPYVGAEYRARHSVL